MEDNTFGFDLSNVLTDEQLAALDSNNQPEFKQETATPVTESKQDDIVNTENLNADDLFSSESVGDGNIVEDSNKGKKDTTTEISSGTPPKNLYSSIAEAFQVDGIFSDLSDDDISKIKTPEDFADVVEKQVQAKLDEKQRRIDSALNNGVEPSQIQLFENSISNLEKITDDYITDESDNGYNLRKNLIINDFLNKGYDRTKAEALAQRSFDAKTDIEDAKYALKQNKEFYQNEYNKLLKEAEDSNKAFVEKRKKDLENLKKSILEEDKAFGELFVDSKTRQRVYDVISKPVYKDPDNNGEYLTEIQKYERDNHNDFMKNLGYLYVITDGFKTLNSITKTIEKKVTKKGIKELEHLVNTTQRNADGSLRMVSGVGDSESYLSGGWSLDTNN